MGNEVWIPIVGSVGTFAVIAFVVWTLSRTKARLAQLRAEFHTKMLDKFGSATEFVEFAKTPEGQKLLEGASMERPADAARLLLSVRRGILLTSLGVAFLGMTLAGAVDSEPGYFIGWTMLALGVGYLVSAIVSRKLMHAWREEINGGVASA
jgi:hypothetical protein